MAFGGKFEIFKGFFTIIANLGRLLSSRFHIGKKILKVMLKPQRGRNQIIANLYKLKQYKIIKSITL
jgi:hypothetical protein